MDVTIPGQFAIRGQKLQFLSENEIHQDGMAGPAAAGCFAFFLARTAFMVIQAWRRALTGCLPSIHQPEKRMTSRICSCSFWR